jgi:hypothetical protein
VKQFALMAHYPLMADDGLSAVLLRIILTAQIRLLISGERK